jgi:hypothetical protein
MPFLQLQATVPQDPTRLNEQYAVRAWRDHAEEIARIELDSIGGRTPEDTKTLFSSLTEEINPNPQTIMSIYTDPEHQLTGPWERVYAQYQEGPPLGHTTYTRGQVQYVYRAASEDLQQIKDWADRVAKDGIDQGVAAVGETTL